MDASTATTPTANANATTTTACSAAATSAVSLVVSGNVACPPSFSHQATSRSAARQSASSVSPSPLVLTVVKGHEDPLSNFYQCKIWHRGVMHRSAEHLYHMIRANIQRNYKIFDDIKRALTALGAKRAAKYLANNVDIDTDVMRFVLREKWRQCPVFRETLHKSGQTYLSHSTYPSDKTWATGLLFSDEDSHRHFVYGKENEIFQEETFSACC